MFKTLKSKILNNNSKEGQLLLDIFEPLDSLEKNISKQITNFILKGDDIEVINRVYQLASNQPLHQLLAYPCSSDRYYLDRDLKKNVKARIRFYKDWTNVYSLQQITRFGKVLAATDRPDNHINVITPKLPLWFLYLLLDGLVTTLPRGDMVTILATERKAWSISQLHDLLELEEAGLGQKLLFAIFDRQNIKEYYLSDFKHFYHFQDLLPYINKHLDIFKSLPEQGLSLSGEIEQLNYIACHPELSVLTIDLLAEQSVSELKRINEVAATILVSSPQERVLTELQTILTQGTAKQRSRAVTILARLSADREIFDNALQKETNKTVINALEKALSALESTQQAKLHELELIIPPYQTITEVALPASAREIIKQNFVEQLAKCEQNALYEIEMNKKNNSNYRYQQSHFAELKKVTETDLDSIFDYINGKTELSQSLLKKKIDENFDFILIKGRLQALPEFNLFHLLRIHKLYSSGTSLYSLFTLFEENTLLLQSDLRQIVDVLNKIDYCSDASRSVAYLFLANSYFNLTWHVDSHYIWPFFAENLVYIDESLGLLPPHVDQDYDSICLDKANAIEILSFFPNIPAKYVSYLLEIAFGDNKSLRVLAQKALGSLPDIHYRAEEALLSAKQDVRINAAQWLAKLGQTSSIKPLKEALKKEKRETVQAVFLVVLEDLGEDISQHLTSKKLLDDAHKGLKGKKPADLEWFDETQLPPLTWKTGETVEPEIIKWWIWLAVKLKEPANPLLFIYTRLLSPQSQHQLGLFVLQSFIHKDTLAPTIQEAEREAKRGALRRQQDYLNYAKRYPEYYGQYANMTLEDAFEMIKKEELARLIGSAIKFKGLLALTSGIEGSSVVPILYNYMKVFYKRRAQIEAMLESIANSDDPLIIQLLLSIARRYRTSSIQEKAKLLVNNIAERNHWTPDELADRTISTAGLDESGILHLDYGEREFTVILDHNFKWILKNPEGKVIKALPEGRKTEDEELVKEAKKQFSNSKKEVKQILDLQISRLYEAMCIQRYWTIADWQKYLQGHPIMNRLIQRLVWLVIDQQGNICQSFRPTEDGSLIDFEDDELTLNEDCKIILAHGALLTQEMVEKWQTHFKDYKIKSLFTQFDHPLPDLSAVKDGIINDYKGWVTDTFTLRGILTKLGYKRDDIGDAGSFDGYYKYFSGSELYINIQFSGSYVPEDNIPAVLYSLYFSKQHGWNDKAIDINEIPPVLLAEGYADYTAVANASSGYDPEWEKKALW